MGERNVKGGRVLLAAALTVLLLGCAYGGAGYGTYGDPYSGNLPMPDLGQVLGPGALGLGQIPIVGPLVDTLLGGALGYYGGYGYNEPYYNDRYYNDPYYNGGYDPYYGDPNYRGGYDSYPYGYGPNYGYNGQPDNRYPYGYDDRYYGNETTPYNPYYPR